MFQDTSSNGTSGGSVAEIVESNNGGVTPESGEPSTPRVVTVRRRAKILSLLEGARTMGTSIADIVHDARAVAPEATPQIVRHDLLRLIEAKIAEERPALTANGPELYILTMKGESEVERHGYHGVALRVTPEESAEQPGEEKLAAAPTRPQDGSTTWATVQQASAQKEAQEQAAKGKGKRKKKGDEPSTQLGFGSAPGRFTMLLPCPLSAEEFRDLQQEHLDSCDKIDALEEERKEANQSFNDRRKSLEAEEAKARASLRIAVMTAKQLRDVECEQRLDGSTMRVVRCDTGETVEERAATSEELQAANPPPATTPAPEGAEVREAARAAEEAKASSTNEPQGQAVSTNEPVEKPDMGTDKPKGKRGRRGNGAAATTH